MAVENNSGSKKQWILFVLLLPFLLFGLMYLYTKQTVQDLSTMKYPHKMFPIGVDTVNEDGFKKLDSVYHQIGNFHLTNQYGQEISKESVNGKIIVADFFFTSCPSICPKMSASLEKVQEHFLRDDELVLLSFTIDPKRDSVPVLKAYADAHNALPGKWNFLTGDKDSIYTLAATQFKLSAQDEGGDEAHQGFVHSDRLVLVDPNWVIRGFYNGTSEEDVNVLMGDIVLLLEEFKR